MHVALKPMARYLPEIILTRINGSPRTGWTVAFCADSCSFSETSLPHNCKKVSLVRRWSACYCEGNPLYLGVVCLSRLRCVKIRRRIGDAGCETPKLRAVCRATCRADHCHRNGRRNDFPSTNRLTRLKCYLRWRSVLSLVVYKMLRNHQIFLLFSLLCCPECGKEFSLTRNMFRHLNIISEYNGNFK